MFDRLNLGMQQQSQSSSSSSSTGNSQNNPQQSNWKNHFEFRIVFFNVLQLFFSIGSSGSSGSQQYQSSSSGSGGGASFNGPIQGGYQQQGLLKIHIEHFT